MKHFKLTKEQIVNKVQNGKTFTQNKLAYRTQYLKPLTKQLVSEGKIKILCRDYKYITYVSN